MTGLTWDEGIIGQQENFLLKRFPIPKMCARAIATSIVSAALSNVTLEDKWGDVKPNLWFLYLAKSGLGFKTPLIKFIRDTITDFDPTLKCPPKFSPEGFTEWVMGVRRKKSKEGEERQEIEEHPANFIIRDEMSKLLKNKFQFPAMDEYLSELWDGYIEGYYTRQFQYEGDLLVYVTMYAASSDLFFDLLDVAFFKQGLGNRILWITEEMPEPLKLDHKEFFFTFASTDKDLDSLKQETVARLRDISQNCKQAFIHSDAAKLWADYQYECAMKAYGANGFVGSYEVKQPLNALKMSVVYAASRLDYDDNGMIIVREGDMKRAIEDVRAYDKMWEKAMAWWDTVKGRAQAEEEVMKTARYDLERMKEIALAQSDHLVSSRVISGQLDLPNITRIIETLELGVNKGIFKVVAETGEQGSLTDEQFKRFRYGRGASPRIYKLVGDV